MGHVPVQANDNGFDECRSYTFQRLMDEVTKDLPFVFTYLDDMLVASKDIEEHDEHLHALFAKLEEFGLAVSHDKCVLGQEQLVFLGYTVNSKGIKPLRDRVEAIVDFPRPDGPKTTQRFLGKVNYYRRMVPNMARIATPLYQAAEARRYYRHGVETTKCHSQVWA